MPGALSGVGAIKQFFINALLNTSWAACEPVEETAPGRHQPPPRLSRIPLIPLFCINKRLKGSHTRADNQIVSR